MCTEVRLELRGVLKNKSQKVPKGTRASKQFCQSYYINTDKQQNFGLKPKKIIEKRIIILERLT